MNSSYDLLMSNDYAILSVALVRLKSHGRDNVRKLFAIRGHLALVEICNGQNMFD